jgi:hypothetical protein
MSSFEERIEQIHAEVSERQDIASANYKRYRRFIEPGISANEVFPRHQELIHQFLGYMAARGNPEPDAIKPVPGYLIGILAIILEFPTGSSMEQVSRSGSQIITPQKGMRFNLPFSSLDVDNAAKLTRGGDTTVMSGHRYLNWRPEQRFIQPLGNKPRFRGDSTLPQYPTLYLGVDGIVRGRVGRSGPLHLLSGEKRYAEVPITGGLITAITRHDYYDAVPHNYEPGPRDQYIRLLSLEELLPMVAMEKTEGVL